MRFLRVTLRAFRLSAAMGWVCLALAAATAALVSPAAVSAATDATVSPAPAATISPDLERRLHDLKPGQTIAILVTFTDQVDLSRYSGDRRAAPDLIRSLQDTAGRSQRRALEYLNTRAGEVAALRSLWINNSVALRATSTVIGALAAFPEVARIEFDEPVYLPDPTPSGGGRIADWNLTIIGADQVWTTLGLDGSGIVVGSMDTGFDPNHPALLGKWRGGSNSWLDLVNGMPDPYDDHGHGTHTVGTMVGGDGPGPAADDIGVAYGAQFISVKVLDSTNSFSSASIVINGAQWMLDPDGDPGTNDFPQVINNSWLFFSSTYTGFYSTVGAWRAAGIVPVFCIGNNGPNPSTTNPPGNYNNTIGVGATDSGDGIAFFSGRGPSPAGTVFPADRRKPDLSAPGDLVRSSVPGGGYQYWSGTSMASPHVAGTVALMLQGEPSVQYDAIRAILLETSQDLGAAGYDYDYGYGRLNAYSAVFRAVTAVGEPSVAPHIALQANPNPFSAGVRLSWLAPAGHGASVDIFDPVGRRIRSLATTGASGSVYWDGRNELGMAVPAGYYFARVSGEDGASNRRVIRIAR